MLEALDWGSARVPMLCKTRAVPVPVAAKALKVG